MSLIYTGDGKYIMGVPAQDLSDEDISRLAESFGKSNATYIDELIGSGIYEKPKPKPTKKAQDTPVEDDES